MSSVQNIRLSYFPFPGRAAAIRDALNMGGIKFHDEHISIDTFRERRRAEEFPFGGLPMLEFDTDNAHVCSAQSNAILRLAGRLSGLYPVDDLVLALKVDEVMDMVEDINTAISPSLHEPDEAKKLAMRKTLAEETLPFWGKCLERLLAANGNSGYLVGNSLSVADLKLYWMLDWLTCGILDGIPPTLFDDYSNVTVWRRNITQVRAAQLSHQA